MWSGVVRSPPTGAQRLQVLARKYGPEELLRIMDEVLDYSERMMRAALTRLVQTRITKNVIARFGSVIMTQSAWVAT